MVAAAALAGEYRLFPGKTPSIEGSRPVLAPGRLGQLLAGQPPDQAVKTLGQLFTLCAHAHQRTARMALAAAHASLSATIATPPSVIANPAPVIANSLPFIANEVKQSISPSEVDCRVTNFLEPPVFLLLETARDHLRSIALDWPQRIGLALSARDQLGWLKACPLPLAAPKPVDDEALAWRLLAQLNDWLGSHVLRQSTHHWLAQHQAPQALAAWCSANAERLLPARCLAMSLQISTPPVEGLRPLNVLSLDPTEQRRQLLELVARMERDPDFCQYPTWHGQCVENGPWTRLRHTPAAGKPTLIVRLDSRWMELLELSQTTPESLDSSGPPLSSGVLITGTGQALAWCEMARGLLLHWAHCDAQGQVLDYKVVAPTEWNFHPQGTLAQALSALAPTDTQAAHQLAAAFDPCVACTV